MTTETEAIERLEGVTPPGGNGQVPIDEDLEPAGRKPWDSDVKVVATCAVVQGRPSSTAGGTRGQVRFELHPEDASALFEAIGQQAFDVTFRKCHLGDGYTIAGISGRPDADGAARTYIDLAAPETAVAALGELFKRRLIGTKGDLVLGVSQVSMSEMLTKRAE